MASEMQPVLTFEGWRYSHYFKLVESKGRNVSVRCTLPWPEISIMAIWLKAQHTRTIIVLKMLNVNYVLVIQKYSSSCLNSILTL